MSLDRKTIDNCEDANTGDEMTGGTVTDASPRKKPRNACKDLVFNGFCTLIACLVTELMSSKPESSSQDIRKRAKGGKQRLHVPDRDGLEAYIVAPESFLQSE